MSIGVVRNVRNKFASRHPLSALAATKRKHILAGNSPETPGNSSHKSYYPMTSHECEALVTVLCVPYAGPDNEEEKPPGAFATVSMMGLGGESLHQHSLQGRK